MANAKFYLSLRVSPLYKKQASRQCLFESLVPLKRLQSSAVILKELAALSVINTELTVAGECWPFCCCDSGYFCS